MSETHQDASHAHVIGFCTSDHFLVSQITEFVSEGLSAGEQVLVVATADHWKAVGHELDTRRVDYGHASARGQLVIVDADAVLEQILDKGKVNVARFREMLTRLLANPGPKRMYGELVGSLTARGDVDGAAQIEAMVHELSHALGVPILCCYNVGPQTPMTAGDMDRLALLHNRSFSEPSEALRPGRSGHFHAVRFYNGSTELSVIVAEFLGEGLQRAESAVVIATPEHREAIAGQLSARGFDVECLTRDEHLILIDAETTLAEFMTDGMPHRGQFRQIVGSILRRAGDRRERAVVRAYGEMVDLLWKKGHTMAATRLETLWNELAKTAEFSLLCGYSMGHFYKNTDVQALCSEHSHIMTGSSGPAGFRGVMGPH